MSQLAIIHLHWGIQWFQARITIQQLDQKVCRKILRVHSNTAIGHHSLYLNTTGKQNTAIGDNALPNNQTGIGNIAIGTNTLTNLSSGSYNTIIGFGADVNGDRVNATAIGNGAIATTDNTIQLGNNSVTDVFTNASCQIWANSFSTYSDRRFKFNIREDVKGIDFIMNLRPVTYNFDEKKLQDFKAGKITADELNMLPLLLLSITHL